MKQPLGSMITFRRPDGKDVEGYLAKPQNPVGAPAIVVIQEWWGLNDQIRGVADRLAQSGYLALVPDLYRGKTTVEEEEAHHLMTGLDFGDAASQDIRGAVQYLKQHAERVGLTGYCMGGALTLLALGQTPELSAGVVWYGCPPLEYIQADKIKVPVQAHWATQDEFFPPACVEAARSQTARRESRSGVAPLSGAPCVRQRNCGRAGPYCRAPSSIRSGRSWPGIAR